MIFEITLNGVKILKDIPGKWEEVTFKQYIELTDKKELTALSIFTGIDAETLKKAQITNLNKLVTVLSFIKAEVPLFNYPKRILTFDLPQDLNFETFGQYSDLKDQLDKGLTGIELIKQYPLFCSIYTTKPYDYKQAEANAELFMNAPCTDVLAVGFFLLMKLVGLNSTIETTSLNRLTPLKRWRLVFKGWLSRLAFRVRFFILKRKLNIQ